MDKNKTENLEDFYVTYYFTSSSRDLDFIYVIISR